MKNYDYAMKIACHIWDNHYSKDSPDWQPLGDTEGVLTQIDNMVTGLTRRYENHCSFCGKHKNQCVFFIAGPTVYICDACVGVCNEIAIEQHHKIAIETDPKRLAFQEIWGTEL